MSDSVSDAEISGQVALIWRAWFAVVLLVAVASMISWMARHLIEEASGSTEVYVTPEVREGLLDGPGPVSCNRN